MQSSRCFLSRSWPIRTATGTRAASAVPSATSRWPMSLLLPRTMARSCVGSVETVTDRLAARAATKRLRQVCEQTPFFDTKYRMQSVVNDSKFWCFSVGSKNVEYKHKVWHEECFICFECKQPIHTQSFLTKGDDMYCTACHEKKLPRTVSAAKRSVNSVLKDLYCQKSS